MTEKEIMQALARLDSVVAAMNLPRVQHLQLVQDVRAVQQRIEMSFQNYPQTAKKNEKESTDVGTDQ